MLISFDIKVNSIIDILIQNIHQLNVTMQRNIDQLRDELNQTMQNTHQLYQQHIYQLRDEFNQTMQIMQTNMENYIASNDFELKAMNDTYYVVKTPLVIAVPSSEEIDDHRGEVSKMQLRRNNFTLRQN